MTQTSYIGLGLDTPFTQHYLFPGEEAHISIIVIYCIFTRRPFLRFCITNLSF